MSLDAYGKKRPIPKLRAHDSQDLTVAWSNATAANMGNISQSFGTIGNVFGSAAGAISGVSSVTLSGTFNAPTINEPLNPRPLKAQWCEISGHMMSSEVEWDGYIMGKCEMCGEKMMGRRLPGGLAVERLQTLVEAALDGEQSLMDLCTDMLRMQELIDAEEKALAEAKALLTLAREKIRQRAVQPKPLSLKDITAA